MLRAAERKWGKSRDPSDLSAYQSLLATFSSAITSAKRDYYHTKINKSLSNPQQLFSIFSSLLSIPAPPPQSSITADDFAAFFDEKIADIQTYVSYFLLHFMCLCDQLKRHFSLFGLSASTLSQNGYLKARFS